MAHGKSPRYGSMQYWPRKRAKRIYPKIRSWPLSQETKLLGFAGYKAGNTHLIIKDNRKTSITKNEDIVCPVTIIECPPIKPFSIRFFKNTPYGIKVITEIMIEQPEKELARRLFLPKHKKTVEERIKEIKNYDDIKILCYTQPKMTGIGKKTPEILEIAIGGKKDDKIKFAQEILGKEITIEDVFKEGEQLDLHAVTKGKGFQGSIKRFGAQLRQHKTEKKIRGVILGPTRPAKALWGIPLPGRMGYNLRTEFSKDLLFVGDKPEKVNPKGGFLHYGLVKSDYVLVKGSVPGPCKRLITLTEPLRKAKGYGTNYEINYVSLESKQ